MRRLKNSLIILIFLALINGSCNHSGKDLSFTPDEYHKLGMPDQKKLSTTHDYVKVLTMLNRIKINDPLSYPRKHSKKSGEVFSCMINKDNLSFVTDTTMSLHDRALQIQFLSSILNTEVQVYTDKLKSEQYYNEELIDFYIYGLFVRKKMFELAEKINKSDASADISMQSGQKMVVGGYVDLINLILKEQVKPEVYHSKDLERLSLELSNSIEENHKLIEPADRQQLSIDIQNIIDKSPSVLIKNNYQKIQKLLKG
jgi:hypothetical protein